MPTLSAKDFLLWEKKQLSKGGEKPSFSLLLESVGGVTQCTLNKAKINDQNNIYINNLDLIESLWEDHLSKLTPIQYLCGYTYWRDLKIKVSRKVLIPRPETELIIDIVQKKIVKNPQKLIFAELGTGSGAVAIALALANPLWVGIATDIDKDAIAIATSNFNSFCNKSNLSFCCGDWWNPLNNFKGKLDIVISNPPYIPKDVYEALPKGVKNFEPKISLFGGEDGLDHIREIVQKAPFYLKEQGWLILENHFDQGEVVKKLFIKNRFKFVEVLKDFAGIGRFTIGRYK